MVGARLGAAAEAGVANRRDSRVVGVSSGMAWSGVAWVSDMDSILGKEVVALDAAGFLGRRLRHEFPQLRVELVVLQGVLEFLRRGLVQWPIEPSKEEPLEAIGTQATLAGLIACTDLDSPPVLE